VPPYAPPDALDGGLIHEVVEADQLLDAAKAAARTLSHFRRRPSR